MYEANFKLLKKKKNEQVSVLFSTTFVFYMNIHKYLIHEKTMIHQQNIVMIIIPIALYCILTEIKDFRKF